MVISSAVTWECCLGTVPLVAVGTGVAVLADRAVGVLRGTSVLVNVRVGVTVAVGVAVGVSVAVFAGVAVASCAHPFAEQKARSAVAIKRGRIFVMLALSLLRTARFGLGARGLLLALRCQISHQLRLLHHYPPYRMGGAGALAELTAPAARASINTL
jgi:hypothetical protein